MAEQKEQQEVIFQRIIFEECDQDAQLRKLSKQEKERLKFAIAQKIANEAVYKPSFPQEDYIEPSTNYHPPSLMGTLCCCLYPEQNRQNFQVTSSLFCKKLCRVFLVWKNDFSKIKDDDAGEDVQSQPDLYGPLWLSITYVILLGLASNINNYFTDSSSFTFDSTLITQALGLCLIFLIAQTMIYPAVVGCLDGQIPSPDSTNLVGYSLMLYLIPTFLCMIPSRTMHLVALLLAALQRFTFLGRNFSSRVDSKEIIVYAVILVIQFLHFYLISSTFFSKVAGASIDEGMQKVLHSRVYQQ